MALARPTPKTGAWTYEDLLALPDDGTRYEIIEGALFEMTGPKPPHALVLMTLIEHLLTAVRAEGGELLAAPIDVFLPGANPVQPDLLALLPGGGAKFGPNGIDGPPDFVAEVLSPSTRVHDTLTKRALYERAGVREYWIVDPEARTIEILALADGAFRSRGVFAGEDGLASALLPEASFAATVIFARLDAIAG